MKRLTRLTVPVLILAMASGLAACSPSTPASQATDESSVTTTTTAKETPAPSETEETVAGDIKGWCESEGKYYFIGREDGKQVKSATVNGIKIDDSGFAVMDDVAKEKLPVLVKAREVYDELAAEGGSEDDIIMRCYKFVEDMPYLLKDYPITDHMKEYACYDAHYANNLLNAYDDQLKLGGDCTSDAACLAYLFDAAGFKEVYYCHTESHAWVEADGRFWDPLYIETKGMEWYDMKEYPDEPLFRQKI